MDNNNNNNNNVTLEPNNDMEFESHEAAYTFYKDYAKSVGFGTAKLSSRRSRASKEFIDAKFSCIRYGNKQQSDDAINPRPSPKIGCKASMHVKRRTDGKWYVFSFVKEHNHELLPAQAHFFRSHRNNDQVRNGSPVRRRKNQASVSKMFGAYKDIDYVENYVRNQHDKGRNLVLEAGDAQLLLELFMQMQEVNPNFFYAVDLNEVHQLRNVFWVDAKGMEDYNRFNDVVCFDTTYFSNKYRIPLVLFIGVNHHVQPTLLGCGLIADETLYTFVWFFQTWLKAMGQKAPQIMLTDQNSAIKAAVMEVFPTSQHFLCLWHILDRIPRHLQYLSLWQEPFMVKLNKCIYMSSSEEQFEKRWLKLLDRFHLREVQWVHSLYEDRKQWMPLFIKGISFAGLSTSSRSESLNSVFDKYIHGETSLREFMERYRLVLEDRDEEEAKSNFDAWHETPELKSPSPFEKQMSLIYTDEIFKKFQVEVLGAAACHLKKEKEDGFTTTYNIKDFEDTQNYVVEWTESKSEMCCSCRSFEYKGYLCRHAIVVLQMSGVFSIPNKYVLKRWTNVAMSKHPLSEKMEDVQSKVRRCNDLCRRAIILGEEGSLSQESYNIALNALRDAFKQCASLNHPVESNVGISLSANLAICGVEEENHNKASKRAEIGKQKDNSENSGIRKRKQVVQITGTTVGVQDGFHQMEQANTRQTQLDNVIPAQLHNMAPAIFHNVAAVQFHNVNATGLPENQQPQ